MNTLQLTNSRDDILNVIWSTLSCSIVFCLKITCLRTCKYPLKGLLPPSLVVRPQACSSFRHTQVMLRTKLKILTLKARRKKRGGKEGGCSPSLTRHACYS
jgi:hypothetical protein